MDACTWLALWVLAGLKLVSPLVRKSSFLGLPKAERVESSSLGRQINAFARFRQPAQSLLLEKWRAFNANVVPVWRYKRKNERGKFALLQTCKCPSGLYLGTQRELLAWSSETSSLSVAA